MNTIANVQFQADLATSRFACDTAGCRGACCTMPGGRGAPIEESEIPEIEKAFHTVRKHLPEEHLQVIDEYGLFEGMPGMRTTMCVDEKACVFSYFEDGVARCGFERAYLEGESSWRKPLSCHLFPLKIRSAEQDVLQYEQIAECRAGREKGARSQIYLYEFLKVPLVRKYGEAWYESFRSACIEANQQPSGRGSCSDLP